MPYLGTLPSVAYRGSHFFSQDGGAALVMKGVVFFGAACATTQLFQFQPQLPQAVTGAVLLTQGFGWYRQISNGSFSAVSKSNFASKCSLESSWRDLQDLSRFTCFCTAQTSIFQKVFVKLFRIFWQKFAKFRYF